MTDTHPASVQRRLEELAQRLDDLIPEMDKATREAAEAEATHKEAYAVAIVGMADSGRRMTADERKARADAQTAELYRHRLLTEAAKDVLLEESRSIRAALSAYQSIHATMRELIR